MDLLAFCSLMMPRSVRPFLRSRGPLIHGLLQDQGLVHPQPLIPSFQGMCFSIGAMHMRYLHQEAHIQGIIDMGWKGTTHARQEVDDARGVGVGVGIHVGQEYRS